MIRRAKRQLIAAGNDARVGHFTAVFLNEHVGLNRIVPQARWPHPQEAASTELVVRIFRRREHRLLGDKLLAVLIADLPANTPAQPRERNGLISVEIKLPWQR